jgi:hypothetical protein
VWCEDHHVGAARRFSNRPPWSVVFIVAFVALAVGLFGAGPASAATASAAETRVGASHSTATVLVGLSADITAGRRLGNSPVRHQIVVATGVAAKCEVGAMVVDSALAVGEVD